MKTNMKNILGRIAVAALFAVLAIFIFKVSAFADSPAIVINETNYSQGQDGNGFLQVHGNINVDSIAAVLIQVLDEQGNTMVVQSAAVELGSGEYKYFSANINVNLPNGFYTVYVSDFAGGASAEERFEVNVEGGGQEDDGLFHANARLLLDGSITLCIEMQIPDQYGKISIDGQKFNLDTVRTQDVWAGKCRLMNIHNGPEPSNRFELQKLVPAKEFDDRVSIWLYDMDETEIIGEENVNDAILSFSVRDYLDQVARDCEKNMPEEGSREYNEMLLCKALDNYGFASQKYFDYHAESCPDVHLEDIGNLQDFRYGVSGTLPEGLQYVGSSLILDGTTVIRHYFKGDVEGVSAQMHSDPSSNLTFMKKGEGDIYYIEVANILSWDLDKPFEVDIYEDEAAQEGGFTLDKYSVFSYCERVLAANKDAKLVEVVNALVQYNQAAKALEPRFE